MSESPFSFQCPHSRRPLQPASPELVLAVNQAIGQQVLLTVEGQAVELPIDAGWFCLDSLRCYPQRQGVLCLIADQALDLQPIRDTVPVGW